MNTTFELPVEYEDSFRLVVEKIKLIHVPSRYSFLT